MANPIVLIPARMNATRLPGKPLADIHGAPMIVHVWRRAVEADIGPVWVATDDRRVMEAVASAGGKAIMTRADHPSGSDRIFEALGLVDADGAHDVVVNVQGDLPTIEPSIVRACLSAPRRTRGRHRDARDADHARAGEGRSQRRQDCRVRTRSGAAESALFHPRARSLGRGAPLASHRSLRLSPRRASAIRRLAPVAAGDGARNSNNCGRWRLACGSTSRSSTRRRSASTARMIWNARERCSRLGNTHEDHTFHRLSGRAWGQFAYRLRREFSRPEPAALRDFRRRFRGRAGRRRPNSP